VSAFTTPKGYGTLGLIPTLIDSIQFEGATVLPFMGTVLFISPSMQLKTATFRLQIRTANLSSESAGCETPCFQHQTRMMQFQTGTIEL
jgi:hypothetical protein